MSEALDQGGQPPSAEEHSSRAANETENAAGVSTPSNEETLPSRSVGHDPSQGSAKVNAGVDNNDPHDCMLQICFCCCSSCTIQ
jgi:hypothetical protein